MKYTFKCPENDGYEVSVEAESDDEAVEMIVEKSKEHIMTIHPDKEFNEEEAMEMVRSAMIKE